MNWHFRFKVVLLVLVSILTGCKEYDSLDYDLVYAIESSTGESKQTLILPYSHDLDSLPQDPLNPLNQAKVTLGKLMFHESALAMHAKMEEGKYTYSCASCHHARAGFSSGNKQGIGDGGIDFGVAGEDRAANWLYYEDDSLDVQAIRTPSIVNVAYQSNLLWNGQFGATGVNEGTSDLWDLGTPKEVNHLGFEGVESQAIAGLEVHRLGVEKEMLLTYQDYIPMFDLAFPDLSFEERYTTQTIGLAIAAYERTLVTSGAPFQHWLRGDYAALTEQQKKGAMLFFGKANCYTCHNGPALNSMEFHALGMDDMSGADVFMHGMDEATKKGRGGFTKNPNDDYKFKVPQLYNLADTRFYGHGGSFESVRDVVFYKSRGVKQNDEVPDQQLADEFTQLLLTIEEIDQITDFILNGLYDNNLDRYTPNELPSGMCSPNNDPLSKIDLGCN